VWFEEVARKLEAQPVRRLQVPEATAAAVLVPLYVAGGELWVLLTRRADHLFHHPGQYAFPGGAKDEEDPDEEAWRKARIASARRARLWGSMIRAWGRRPPRTRTAPPAREGLWDRQREGRPTPLAPP